MGVERWSLVSAGTVAGVSGCAWPGAKGGIHCPGSKSTLSSTFWSSGELRAFTCASSQSSRSTKGIRM